MSEPPTRDPRGEQNPASASKPGGPAGQPDGSPSVPTSGPANGMEATNDPAQFSSQPEDIDPYGDQPQMPSTPTNGAWQLPARPGGDPLPHNGASRHRQPGSTPASQHFEAGSSASENGPTSRAARPQSPSPSGAIDGYRVRSARGPVVMVVVVAVIIVAVLITLAVQSPKNPAPATSPSSAATSSAARTPSSTVAPSALPESNTIPIDYNGFQGQWTITGSSWDATGLTLDMEITSSKGSLGFSFFALDTGGGSNQYKASGALATGTVTAGSKATGRVFIAKPHSTTLVILANSYGRQITALTVDA